MVGPPRRLLVHAPRAGQWRAPGVMVHETGQNAELIYPCSGTIEYGEMVYNRCVQKGAKIPSPCLHLHIAY